MPPASADTFAFPIGSVQASGSAATLRPTEELLKTHLAILGGTRQGKSKLFELICRQLAMQGRGFAFIDPHSDTADDLFSFLSFHYEHLGFARENIHYLNPNETLFAFDPFAYRPDPNDPQANSEFRYRNWFDTKIEAMTRIIVRQQGDTEDEAQKMVRLRRWLFNALYAVGVRQDQAGTHLPMRDAFVLLNPEHPRHDDLYAQVEPFLSDPVRSDFEKLRRTKDARKQEDWVESTFNRLRDILSPVVERIFNLEAPTIDFCEIIRRNGIVLASLGKTPYFKKESALAIAGLLIREISDAAQLVSREARNQFYLFIDEAHNFLGDDLERMFAESAKFKLSLGIAVQDLSRLQKGELDLVPAVLSQCGVRITFQQQYHEHAEILAKSFCYGNLNFEPLLHEVDRPDGYDWLLVPSVSIGQNNGRAEERSQAVSHETATSEQHSISITSEESKGFGNTREWTRGESIQLSEEQTESVSSGETRQWGSKSSRQETEATSVSNTDGASHAQTHETGRSTTHESGHSSERSHSRESSSQSSRTHDFSRSRSDAAVMGAGGHSHVSRDDAVSKSSQSNMSSQTERFGDSQSTFDSKSDTQSESSGEKHEKMNSDTRGRERGSSRGEEYATTSGHTFSRNRGRSLGFTEAENSAFSRGESVSLGASDAITDGEAMSKTESQGQSETVARTKNSGHSRSLSLQPTPLARYRQELQETGKLRWSIPDQLARFTAQIMALPKQHCLISASGFALSITVRVHNVFDPFEQAGYSELWKGRLLEYVKSKVFAEQPYYFSPDQIESDPTTDASRSLTATKQGSVPPPKFAQHRNRQQPQDPFLP